MMDAQEARDRVTEMRRALDRAMRAVSEPEPDWHKYHMSLTLLAMLADDATRLAMEVANAD